MSMQNTKTREEFLRDISDFNEQRKHVVHVN